MVKYKYLFSYNLIDNVGVVGLSHTHPTTVAVSGGIPAVGESPTNFWERHLLSQANASRLGPTSDRASSVLVQLVGPRIHTKRRKNSRTYFLCVDSNGSVKITQRLV